MAKKMLIDATHDEEVRVAIVDGNRLEEFDSETSTKRQIKGNIYLAKIIRIEPSLQAAFVEFGGNRHGFLPFGEIHPDYFRIPVSDRSLAAGVPKAKGLSSVEISGQHLSDQPDTLAVSELSEIRENEPLNTEPAETGSPPNSSATDDMGDTGIDLVDEDELPRRPRNYHYKIQEVIKRRQIMLIQVIKEERGNKGASLTTYLSLAGRYCAFLPNAGYKSLPSSGYRGGGISRKIIDSSERRRLRDVLRELEIPEGMSLIVRTAGQERNKLEIRRDFDYLIRLWEEIRSSTLVATAPELIYAEGDLIKRSIRDIYNKDIDQILVDGDEAYKAAKGFMKALIPSHTKKVQSYKDLIPLFHRYKVEEQIDVIMYPMAKLPSGGSIVINPTEALVAIDVNSGRSTRERHIDDTALKTNLEAADEIARQIRLRDLAGLIVIDFIDMKEPKHNQAVEKRLKEATRLDRARIQIGHISHFGLLEMSRQRMRPSLIETNSSSCHHCRGTGLIRSVESTSLLILRAIENAGIEGKSAQLVVTVPSGIDLYLLNQKRASLTSMEDRYKMSVIIARDDTLISPDFRLECLAVREIALTHEIIPLPLPPVIEEEEEGQEESPVLVPGNSQENVSSSEHSDERGNSRRRRRRRPSSRKPEDNNTHSAHGTADITSENDTGIPIENRIENADMGTVDPEGRSNREGSEPENKIPGAGHVGHEHNLQSDTERESHKPAKPSGREYPRRRRNNFCHPREANDKVKGENTTSPAQSPDYSGENILGKMPLLPTSEIFRPKSTEVVVPITALPVGIENRGTKNSRGRWWKRLLES